MGMVQAAAVVLEGYELVWSDDFRQPEGAAPDPQKWVYDLGNSGWGNKELENYTQDVRNVSVVSDPQALDGKALQIKAIREPDGSYSSGRIKTKGKFSFQYGYIEARLKLPYGQGIWPAFWMLGDDIDEKGWPACGEIDIMENIGRPDDQSICHGTLHGPGYSGDKGLTSQWILPKGKKFKDAYHVFAVDWAPDRIDFYVDGQLYKTKRPSDLPTGTLWVFNHPFFMILNLAVGGIWPGYPDPTTEFPQTLRVDYVRVYQRQ